MFQCLITFTESICKCSSPLFPKNLNATERLKTCGFIEQVHSCHIGCQVEIGRSLNIRAKVRTKVDRLIKLDGSLTKRRRPKSAEAKVLLDFTLDDTFICVVVHIEPFFGSLLQLVGD